MLEQWVPFDVLREQIKDRIPDGFTSDQAFHVDSIPKQLEGNYFDFETRPEQAEPKIETRNKTLVFVALKQGEAVVGTDGIPELHVEIAGFAARQIGDVWYFSGKDDDVDLVRAELEDRPLDVLRKQKEEERERIKQQTEQMKELRENFKYPG